MFWVVFFKSAPNQSQFEQLYKVVVSMPINKSRQIFGIHINLIDTNQIKLNNLSKKELVLYGLVENN